MIPAQRPTHLTKQCASSFVEQVWLICIHIVGDLSQKVLVTFVGEVLERAKLSSLGVGNGSGCF